MVPQWGDKVDSGTAWVCRIGLPGYVLCSLAGRYDNHMNHEFGYRFFWINDTYYCSIEGREKRNITLNSRLCDFLEKGKEKELSNILFLTMGGKSICKSKMKACPLEGQKRLEKAVGESQPRSWLKRYCVSTRHARNCQRPKSLKLPDNCFTWRTK
jgi:hypothetical protein